MKASRVIVGSVLYVGAGVAAALLESAAEQLPPILALTSALAAAVALGIALAVGIAAATFLSKVGRAGRQRSSLLAAALLGVATAYVVVYFRQEALAPIALVAAFGGALYLVLLWSRPPGIGLTGHPKVAAPRDFRRQKVGLLWALMVGLFLGTSLLLLEVLVFLPSQARSGAPTELVFAVARYGWPTPNLLALAAFAGSTVCVLAFWKSLESSVHLSHGELALLSFAATTINFPWVSRGFKNYLMHLDPGVDFNTFGALEVGVSALSWVLTFFVVTRIMLRIWRAGKDAPALA